VKLLHLSLIGRAGALRFEREAAILARLAHPNIAQMLDAGVTPEGQPYLVLELVEGERIDWHCNAQRLSIEQRLALFGDVLAALAHAHSHLVIHRDIKPNNIFVTRDGCVKLLDFGIAKLLQEEADTTSITADGHRVMTPQYAAPEQLQSGAITTATDVYALGVLLFQLLVGRHPTAAEHASSAEVIRATLEADPMRLSTALADSQGRDEAPIDLHELAARRSTTLPRLRRQLRGDLENIVNRALRKDPSERYQTVAALAEDLRRHLAHEPVSARPDSLAYRCAKFVRRHRGGVAAGSLVSTSIVAGLVGTVTQAQRAEAEARHAATEALSAKQERDMALQQLSYAESSNEFISFLLQEGSEKSFTTSELLNRGEQLVDHQFSDDAAQRAHLQLMLADLYGQASKREKAEPLLAHALTAAQTTSDLPLQLSIECQLALQLGDNGSFDQSRKMYGAVIAKLEALPGADRAILARCLHGRSEMLNASGDTKAALIDIQAALDLLGKPRPDQRSEAIEMRSTLAMVQRQLGQGTSAERELSRAIAELEQMGRANTEMSRTLYNNLGVLLFDAGQIVQSADAYARAQRLAGTLGEDASVDTNYASTLVELGRSPEAMPLVERALAEDAAHGNGHKTAEIALDGALAWCAASDFARCEAVLAMAKTELSKAEPESRSIFATLALRQSEVALARGNTLAARASLDKAIAILEAIRPKNRGGIRTRTLLARIELQLGDPSTAQAHAASAVEDARQSLDGFPHSAWLGNALMALGMTQRAKGQVIEAQRSWREALSELDATIGHSAPNTLEVRRLLMGP